MIINNIPVLQNIVYWANIFVIISFIFTLLTGTASIVSSHYLNKAKDEQSEGDKQKSENAIISLHMESQKANKAIAIANAQASLANAEAAKANEKAEAERLVRVKMEIDLAPRIITINKEAIDELTIFSGTNVFIQVDPYDNESKRLAGQINNLLKRAGWNILGITIKPPSPTGMEIFGKGNTIIYGETGVKIYTKRTGLGKMFFENNKWNDAAIILRYCLIDNKIEAHEIALFPQMNVFPPNSPKDTVLIDVCSKPQPYFQDKQRLESLEKAGMLKEKEEIDHLTEMQMEETAQHSPSMRKLVEESRQRNESVVKTWEREKIQKQKKDHKEEKEKILQKYKINN